ncbi:hypothetical protein HY311_02450 [Candidatus Nomurabacteria bacterium]|nr:hypothetical protein [Candidatus Nomurabacteria bacterium]
MTPEESKKLEELQDTSKTVKTLTERFSDLAGKLSDINGILIAVIVVLFVGFATAFVSVWGLVLDANRFKTETYQNLVDKVNDQNYRIEDLNKTVNLVCKTWRKDCPQ